jgi:hypothetical protein
MAWLPLVARCYSDIVQRLGVCTQPSGEGRATLVARAASDGAESLASLSELALALAYTSALRDGRWGPPIKLRIGISVARTVWSGPIRASAEARPCGHGWLLDCEIRDEQGRLLSTAFGHAPD